MKLRELFDSKMAVSVTRFGRILALLAAIAAFGVYWFTLARTITWQHDGADSGDLATAAFVYGIPHPPGYPLYTLIAFFFARNPLFEPAHGVAIFSALMASAAVFVLARAGSALILRPSPEIPRVDFTRGFGGEDLVPPLAALAFAFSPLVWSQALIPEVYALNLFLVSLVLWACVTTSPRRVYIAALAFGLGMAHHLSILLLVPGAWIALQPTRQHRRAVFLLVLPLVAYLYLPFAALPNPPVKWGDPVTLDRFLWLVTAELYRPYLTAVDATAALSRFAFAARSLLDQFTLVGVALLVWGALQMAMRRRRLFSALLVMVLPVVVYSILYGSRDSFLYLLPAFAIGFLWMVYGTLDVVAWAGQDRLLRTGAVALLALLPIYNVVTHYGAMDISRDRTAFEYARQNFEGLPEDAVLFADGDEGLFSTWYYRHAIAYEGARSVIVSQSLIHFDWYYDSLRRIMSEVTFQDPSVVTGTHDRAKEIIRVTFAEGRAVCFTDSSPLLPDFEYEERGILKCVVSEKTQ